MFSLRLAILLMPTAIFSQGIDWIPAPKSGNPKLESQLQDIAKEEFAAAKVSAIPANIQLTTDGKVVVILVPVGYKADDILDSDVEKTGGDVLARSKHLVRIAVTPDLLNDVTAIPGVAFVRRPFKPQSNAISEGVNLINAGRNHSRNVKGQGIKVAVIDDGFERANFLQRDMPEQWRYVDFTNEGIYVGGVHGTACAEIIYDVAPEAELYLLRIGDLLDLENAKDFCVENDIDIISHSMSWVGTGFGDGRGRACEIAIDATENDILWVNSAGNYAQRQYSSFFRDSDSDGWHNVKNQVEVIRLEDVKIGDTIKIWFTWNDWPVTRQDYNLHLYRRDPDQFYGLSKEASSENLNNGTEPYEKIEYEVQRSGEYRVALYKTPDARTMAFKVWSAYHDLTEVASLVGNIATPADAPGVMSVGAIDHGFWRAGRIEDYSSRGPTADGRIKPDLVAPSGVSTASKGRSGFSGTSAAAPHVAGAAALIKSSDPSLTLEMLFSRIEEATSDLGDRGRDNVFGVGKLSLPLLTSRLVTNVTTVIPSQVKYSDNVTIWGNNFGNSRGDGRVVFKGEVEPRSWQYVNWSDTRIVVRVPTGARTGEITVVTDSGQEATFDLTVTSPWVRSVSTKTAKSGNRVIVFGENFNTDSRIKQVALGSSRITKFVRWSGTSVTLVVPRNARTGDISVKTDHGLSNRVRLEITSPYLSWITPRTGAPGDLVSIAGGQFGKSRGASYVSFNGYRAIRYNSWSNSRIVAEVPSRATSGPVKVTTGDGDSGTLQFQVLEPYHELPATGPFGYSPPSVTTDPKQVEFEFEGIGRDVLLTYELKEVLEGEIWIYLNGNKKGIHRASEDWKTWYWMVKRAEMRRGQNVISFKNIRNTNRTSGFDRWQLRSVKLWKPFNAKPIMDQVVSNDPPRFFGFGLPYPSPFNSEVTIPFQVHEHSDVTMDVVNLLGQRVATLLNSKFEAGDHVTTWNGTDSTGRPVASGMYWLVLHVGGSVDIAKAVLMK